MSNHSTQGRSRPSARRQALLAFGVVVVALLLSACQTPAQVYDGVIKNSRAHCEIRGNLQDGFDAPTSIEFRCTMTYSGSGEHPYLLLAVDGCQNRYDGGASTSLQKTLTCTGDGIYTVGVRLCQTHGGLLPDDCDTRRLFSFAP